MLFRIVLCLLSYNQQWYCVVSFVLTNPRSKRKRLDAAPYRLVQSAMHLLLHMQKLIYLVFFCIFFQAFSCFYRLNVCFTSPPCCLLQKPCEAAHEINPPGYNININCTGVVKEGDILLKKTGDYLLECPPALHYHCAKRDCDFEV